MGENGILKQASNAKNKTEEAAKNENQILGNIEDYIDTILQDGNKRQVQGAYICVNNVHPQEHDLKVNLTSNTVTDFSTVSISKYGSNLLDMSKLLNSNLVDNNDGTYNFNFTGKQFSAYYDIFIPAGVPIMATANVIETTLTRDFAMQLVFEDGSKDYIIINSTNSTWNPYSKCLTYNKNITKIAFVVVYGAQSGEYITFSEPKLNVGYIQTYSEYIEPQTIIANSDGTVNGLKSISPNMTLITDNNSVRINCEYNLQKAIYNLYGKTIVNFGDSIFGNYGTPNDISTYIANMTNAIVYNVGFGGCRMAEHPSPQYDAFGMYRLADSIANKDWSMQDDAIASMSNVNFTEKLATLKSIDFSKVDIITIAYGTNDFSGSDSYETKFKNALRHSIETISNAYPNIEIVLCTPIYRFWMDENGEFLEDSDTSVKSGKKLTDFVQWIKEVASEYNLYVIDNYNESGINSTNRAEVFPSNDGTHPNSIGRKMIAENMAKKLYEKFK